MTIRQKLLIGVGAILNVGVSPLLGFILFCLTDGLYNEKHVTTTAMDWLPVPINTLVQDIIISSVWAAVFATLGAFAIFYLNTTICYSVKSNLCKVLCLWLSILSWIIIFSGSASASYDYYMERSNFLYRAK